MSQNLTAGTGVRHPRGGPLKLRLVNKYQPVPFNIPSGPELRSVPNPHPVPFVVRPQSAPKGKQTQSIPRPLPKRQPVVSHGQ